MSARLELQDRSIFGMLMHGVAPGTIGERLSQLEIRQAAMLRSLTLTRRRPVLPTDDAAPLDYERSKRRSSLYTDLS